MADKKEVRFIIDAPPMGKERPRMARQGGFVRTYTPEKTTKYQEMVRNIYSKEVHYDFGEAPIEIIVNSYFGIPSSWPKYKQKEAREGLRRPTVKPDFDNLAKIIADALNEIAYADDKQVVDAAQHKYYSEVPHTEVIIREV